VEYRNPGRSGLKVSAVICAATTPEQVSLNVKAGALRLSAQDREAVGTLTHR